VNSPVRIFVELTALATGLIACAPANAQAGPDGTLEVPGYTIETIALPKDVRFEVGGLDISETGDVAVVTRMGDVWILPSASAAGPADKAQWRLFAEGLGEALGVKWESPGSVLVSHKHELTRLIDRNGDGTADRSENVADGWSFNQNYHEFHFGPAKDSAGNLYGSLNLASGDGPGRYNWRGITKMTSGGRYRGWVYQVQPDGTFTPFASGFRSPAGISVSPEDQVFVTDNQGDWLATSPLYHVKKGHFYGHPASLIDDPRFSREKLDAMDPADFDKIRTKAAVLLPHEEIAQSPGNPVWDTTGGKFGPFAGQMFIPDYTKSSVVRVMLETVGGEIQGAVIDFMRGFQSGNLRADFDPQGRLWIGQTARGWPTAGREPFGVQRVVWDSKTIPFALHNISLTKTGFDLTFTRPVDPKTFNAKEFTARQWHYNYWSTYGSPKVDDIAVQISSAKLSKDGKTVSLVMPLTADRIVAIDFSGVKGLDGAAVDSSKVYYTLNRLRP